MLKRLSASLAPSSSAPPSTSPSISPSHSSSSLSLDRRGAAGQQPSLHSHTHTLSSSLPLGSSPSYDAGIAGPFVGQSYPRPSGLSTPRSTTSLSNAYELSPAAGYFGGSHSSSSAGTGGLSPSLHATSRNVSPAHSPRMEYRPLPPPSSTSSASLHDDGATLDNNHR